MNTLFGADGIRGVIDCFPLRQEDLDRLGRSIASFWLDDHPRPSILVGTDTRESSQRIKVGLVNGLARAGVEVVDGGILPTAAVSFLVASKPSLSGGAMVSASHNPVIENGIKLFDGSGVKLSDPNEKRIESLFFGNQTLPSRLRPSRVIFEQDFANQYARALAGEYSGIDWRPGRLLLDCANGAAYQVAPLVMDLLGLRTVLLHACPNGTNINLLGGSEYVRGSPRQFASSLSEHGAEIGIALDGDADRVVIVDREGGFYDGDFLLAILALRLFRQHALQKDTVVTTQMSNSGLEAHLRRNQILVQVVRNGDKYITDELRKKSLTLGGEAIGHLILHTSPVRVTGDGLRTALSVLEILSENPQASLYDLTGGMLKLPQVNASAVLGKRVQQTSEQIPGLGEVLDQIRESIPDLTRLECRPASTEPVYRVMLEARYTAVPILAGFAGLICWCVQHALIHSGSLLARTEGAVEVTDCVQGGRINVELGAFVDALSGQKLHRIIRAQGFPRAGI